MQALPGWYGAGQARRCHRSSCLPPMRPWLHRCLLQQCALEGSVCSAVKSAVLLVGMGVGLACTDWLLRLLPRVQTRAWLARQAPPPSWATKVSALVALLAKWRRKQAHHNAGLVPPGRSGMMRAPPSVCIALTRPGPRQKAPPATDHAHPRSPAITPMPLARPPFHAQLALQALMAPRMPVHLALWALPLTRPASWNARHVAGRASLLR